MLFGSCRGRLARRAQNGRREGERYASPSVRSDAHFYQLLWHVQGGQRCARLGRHSLPQRRCRRPRTWLAGWRGCLAQFRRWLERPLITRARNSGLAVIGADLLQPSRELEALALGAEAGGLAAVGRAVRPIHL